MTESEPWERNPLVEGHGMSDTAEDPTAERSNSVHRQDSEIVLDKTSRASASGSELALPNSSEIPATPIAVDAPCQFTYQDLKKVVTSKHWMNPILINTVLILFSGLPVKNKDRIVNGLMRMCINHRESLDQCTYEVAVVSSSIRRDHDWFEHSPCSLYRFALASGVKYKGILKNMQFAFNFDTDQSHIFSDERLKYALSQYAENLRSQKAFQKSGFELTDPDVYWRQALLEGLWLMNIWDIPLNRAVLHSLSVITGRLHQSHIYLFVDLKADVPRLSDPPDIPKEQKRLGDEHLLMKYRSRLEYLVRSATVAKSINEHKSNACTIVAVHDGTSETELINHYCTQLQKALLEVVKKMKVENLIDQDPLVLDYSSRDCSRVLKEHIEKSMCKSKSKDEFPPSWLFLLDTLKCLGDVFIEKAELEKMAQECEVVGKELEQMLTRFTAFGSVIYIPDTSFLSKVVILQPQAFVEKLSELYYSKESEETKVHNMYGILTTEAAEKIFGGAASMYLQILRSAQVSMLLPTNEVHNGCGFKTAAKSVDYIPSIRVMQRKAGCDTSSLHLLVSHDFAPINTHVAVASSIFDGLKKDHQVLLVPVKEPNVTKFKIEFGEVSATLLLIYQSNMYEIQLQAPQEPREFLANIRLGISQACMDATWRRKKRFADIKISFVVICPSCHNSACRCDASHIQCYLPLKEQCKRCGHSPAPSSPFSEWEEAVNNTHIPIERSHIKDSVNPEILLKIASQLSEPDNKDSALKHLPQALGLAEQDRRLQQRKLGLRGMFLSMFLLWEEKRDLGKAANSELALILEKLGYDDLALLCEQD